MIWIFALLSTALFANTFDVKGTPKSFSLVIDSRALIYNSEKVKIQKHIQPCNLPLVRELNSELMGQVPVKEADTGLQFLVDGNSHVVEANGKEAKVLLAMDERMTRFQTEEKKSCETK